MWRVFKRPSDSRAHLCSVFESAQVAPERTCAVFSRVFERLRWLLSAPVQCFRAPKRLLSAPVQCFRTPKWLLSTPAQCLRAPKRLQSTPAQRFIEFSRVFSLRASRPRAAQTAPTPPTAQTACRNEPVFLYRCPPPCLCAREWRAVALLVSSS